MKEPVTFKGKHGSLEVMLNADLPFEEIKQAIVHKLESKRSFFAGAGCVRVVGGKRLDDPQKKELVKIFVRDFGMIMVEFCDEEEIVPAAKKPTPRKRSSFEHTNETNRAAMQNQMQSTEPLNLRTGVNTSRSSESLFVNETVRNGQRVEFNGDVIVIGDVNNSAEIIAGGSIAVLGVLRGIARAGAWGNESATVTAFRLSPQQLRIGALIAIAPDGENKDTGYPETASVRNGSIVIEPVSKAFKVR